MSQSNPSSYIIPWYPHFSTWISCPHQFKLLAKWTWIPDEGPKSTFPLLSFSAFCARDLTMYLMPKSNGFPTFPCKCSPSIKNISHDWKCTEHVVGYIMLYHVLSLKGPVWSLVSYVYFWHKTRFGPINPLLLMKIPCSMFMSQFWWMISKKDLHYSTLFIG